MTWQAGSKIYMEVQTSKDSEHTPEYKRTGRWLVLSGVKVITMLKFVSSSVVSVWGRQSWPVTRNRDPKTYPCVCGNLVYDTCVLLDHGGKDILFNKRCRANWLPTEKKNWMPTSQNSKANFRWLKIYLWKANLQNVKETVNLE